MDNIILGLLIFESRTIYQLRARIRKGMNLMYSSSMSSIQAAVKKLLSHGYIRYEETIEGGKYKKIYSITDSGKHRFSAWINSPFDTQNMKNPELVKVYFMGLADKENRKKCIRKYLSHLEESYYTLEAVCEEAKAVEITEDNKDILFYQLAAARYGRDFLKFTIAWYQKLINEMDDEKGAWS